MNRMTNFRSAAIATGNAINDSAYDNVKIVADNINDVVAASGVLPDIQFISPYIVDIQTIASNIFSINEVGANVADINLVAGVTNEVAILASIQNAISSLYADKLTLDDLHFNLTSLMSVAGSLTQLTSLYNDKLTLDSIFADKATLDSIFADKAALDSLYLDKAKLDSIYADKLTLDRIYLSIGNIDRVHTSITNVDRIFTSIDNIDSVAPSVGNIDTVAPHVLNIDAVAPSIGNINTVGINIADINTLAPISTNISLVAADILNVNTVAGSIGNVNSVGTNISAVQNVDLALTDVTNVSSISADVTAVSGIKLDVTSVAQTVVPNITEILQADANALTATNKALAASHWAEYPVGSPVPEGNGTEFSAKHWASQAKASIVGSLTYRGPWSAKTAFPVSPVLGDYYKVTVAGPEAVAPFTYNINDAIIYNGTGWDQLVNTSAVTKTQVGLSNVDNTSDLNKPISTATQTALNNKLDITAKAADADKLDGLDSTAFAKVNGDSTKTFKVANAVNADEAINKGQLDTALANNKSFNYISKSTNYTALANDFIYADTSVASFTITLPATPLANDVIAILDNASSFDTNPLTVARNGNNIMGLAEDMIVSTKNISLELIFNGTEWRIK